jgi:transposase
MKRFIEGGDRTQIALLPECLDDYVGEDNPVRVVEVFVDELDLGVLGFDGVDPAATGRPAYHPSVLLRSTSTATSIASSPAGAWSARPSAMSSSCG